MDKRVLVVDDEKVVLDAIRRTLRQSGLEIDTAESAAEALKLLSTYSYGLVITDLMMPEIDGLELLRRIRVSGTKTAAIMITGYPSIQTALEAKRLGAFEYVTKPFTHQELHSVVVRAIRAGAAGAVRGEPSRPSGAEASMYFLPGHSWFRVEADGTVRVGMARAFALTIGEIVSFQLPVPGAWLEQGRVCVVVQAADGVAHSLYVPVTGSVLEVNAVLLENPSVAGSDPEHEGWLLRLAARNLDTELPNLSPA